MADNKIRVKETLVWPSGKTFPEGDIYCGHWNYVSSVDKKTPLPLCVVVRSDGAWLVHKDNFELVDELPINSARSGNEEEMDRLAAEIIKKF